MATKIVTKNSSTASAVPTASDLVQGELAVNVADKRLFTEDNAGAIVELGTNPTTLNVNGTATMDGLTVDVSSGGVTETAATLKNNGGGANTKAGLDFFAASTRYAGIAGGYGASAPELSFDISGTDVLAINSTGIDVTGTATMDGLTVQQPSGANILLESTTSGATTGDIFGEIEFKTNDSSSAGVKGKIDSYSEGGVGNGALRLFTGNTTGLYERLRIDSSGNVGINVTNPGAPLDIGAASPKIRLTDTGGGYSELRGNGGVITLTADAGNTVANSAVTFETDGSERMRIDSSGQLKVNTTNWPSSTVGDAAGRHIFGGSAEPVVILWNEATPVANNHSSLFVGAKSATGSTNFGGGWIRGGIENNSDSDGFLSFFTTYSTVSNAERMRIDSSGQLLLGRGANVASGAEATRIQFYNTVSTYDIASIRSLVGAGQVNRGELSFAVNNGAGQQERMRIDYSGNVQVKGGNELRVYRGDNATYGSMKYLTGSGGLQLNDKNGDGISFVQADGATEYMRIDSSGNLLIGKTTTGVAGAGTVIRAGGELFVTRAGDVMNLNRLTSDGEILVFRKDGVSVGSISTNANSLPSDRNFKKNIADLTLGLDFVKSLSPKTYNFKIDDEGQAVMAGLIAQEVEESLTAAGVERNSMTLLQHEPTEDVNESDYKIDYVKFVPILINAMKEQQTLIESLTARIATLEE